MRSDHEDDFTTWFPKSEEEQPPQGLLASAFRWLLWGISVLAGIYVASVFWDGLELRGYYGNADDRWFPFIGLVVFASAVFLLLREYRSDHRRQDLLVPAALVGIFLLMSGFIIYETEDHGEQLVRDYCSYGARSAVQWVECVQHVDPGQVVFSKTAAADFANGKTDDCGSGAGPFCGDAAQGREYREALAELEGESSLP